MTEPVEAANDSVVRVVLPIATTIIGVVLGHFLSRHQSRSERKAADIARWSETGARALARVRLFLVQAHPDVATSGVIRGDEESAVEALTGINELRMAYLEPLLILVDQHPNKKVSEVAEALAADCTRVFNRAMFRIRWFLRGKEPHPDREQRAEELHEIAVRRADELAVLLRGPRD